MKKKNKGTRSKTPAMNHTEKSIRLYAKRMTDSLVVTASSMNQSCTVSFGRELPLTAPKNPEFHSAVLGCVREYCCTRPMNWSAIMVLYTIDENLDEVPELHNTSCTNVNINDFDDHMAKLYDTKSKEFTKGQPDRNVFGWGWMAVVGLVTAEEWSKKEDEIIDSFDADVMFNNFAKGLGADVVEVD